MIAQRKNCLPAAKFLIKSLLQSKLSDILTNVCWVVTISGTHQRIADPQEPSQLASYEGTTNDIQCRLGVRDLCITEIVYNKDPLWRMNAMHRVILNGEQQHESK